MIDEYGYRPNVGIILCNDHGQVLWARRIGQDAWQFPQGGIKEGETPEKALFRELQEEVGLSPQQVQILGCTRGWLRYRLPRPSACCITGRLRSEPTDHQSAGCSGAGTTPARQQWVFRSSGPDGLHPHVAGRAKCPGTGQQTGCAAL